MKFSPLNRSWIAGLLVACLAGCGSGHDDHAGHDHGPGEHGSEGEAGHAHSAPNGGLLVVLGEEAAHLELLHDAETGELRANVLGAHAENYIRVVQATIDLQLDGVEGPVSLAAVASDLSGETVGDTSVFALTDPRLKGIELGGGTVVRVEMLGTVYEQIAFAGGE